MKSTHIFMICMITFSSTIITPSHSTLQSSDIRNYIGVYTINEARLRSAQGFSTMGYPLAEGGFGTCHPRDFKRLLQAEYKKSKTNNTSTQFTRTLISNGFVTSPKTTTPQHYASAAYKPESSIIGTAAGQQALSASIDSEDLKSNTGRCDLSFINDFSQKRKPRKSQYPTLASTGSIGEELSLLDSQSNGASSSPLPSFLKFIEDENTSPTTVRVTFSPVAKKHDGKRNQSISFTSKPYSTKN